MRILEFNLGFESHNELNPALWQNDQLQPTVKSALTKIAEDFVKFIDVPFKVVDLIITGGQVSYYYTKHSDLDLHLVVDFDSVACDREAAELFDAKRLLYKKRFDITVHGIPVELYVEDTRYPSVSSSYSLFKDQWIKEPTPHQDTIDDKEIERVTAIWDKIIWHIIESKDVKMAKKIMDLLRKYRQIGLNTTGEFGTPNLVYKTLRNSNSVGILSQFLDQAHDRSLSI